MPTTKSQPIEIALSERPPVRIDPDLWQEVAQATNDWPKGQLATIAVRAHADGRRIVYGHRTKAGERLSHGGFLLDANASSAETVRAIRRVAGLINARDLADDCIAKLPAEELK